MQEIQKTSAGGERLASADEAGNGVSDAGAAITNLEWTADQRAKKSRLDGGQGVSGENTIALSHVDDRQDHRAR